MPKKKERSVLDQLRPDEAARVLQRLLDRHPELRAEAAQVATALLTAHSCEAIADEVESAVLSPGIERLNAAAGDSGYGYVSPGDAAYEILEEEVRPQLDDMLRLVSLGLEAEALEVCQGLLLGLYRAQDAESHDVLGWAPDFPADMAREVLDLWVRGSRERRRSKQAVERQRPEFPEDFVDDHVPDWDDLVHRALEQR